MSPPAMNVMCHAPEFATEPLSLANVPDIGEVPLSSLRRKLGTIEAFGLSLSIVGPTVVISFITTLMGQVAGRAIPLAFLIGAVTVALIGLSFVAFAHRVAHAGSVYAYISDVFGSRCGFVAGWMLLISYVAFTAGATALGGSFAAAALAHAGIETPDLWIPISVAGATIASWLVWTDTRIAMRLILVLEGVSVTAILFLALVILIHVPPSLLPLVPDSEHGWSGVGFGTAFAITALAGFEGAATLGEEALEPKRAIPLAVLGTVVVVGLFYVVVSYAEVIGYGLNQVQLIARAEAPLDELSTRFISGRFAVLIDLAAAASGFACVIGALSAGARLVYALGRAGLSSALSRVHPQHGTPTRAVLLVAGINLVSLLLLGRQIGVGPYAGALATIATLALILVYMGVTAAEAVFAFHQKRTVRCIIGSLGTLLLLWPLWNSLYPLPDWPGSLWPYLVVAWLIVGVVLCRAKPSVSDIDCRPQRLADLKCPEL
jgi:amino acid transporter